MLGVDIAEYRQKIARLKRELETTTGKDKLLIYDDLYNYYLRLGLMLEAEKVAFEHIVLLRQTMPKNKLVSEELRLTGLLMNNGKIQQGLEHLDYALKVCDYNEVENKEWYLSQMLKIYQKLSARDEKYKTKYNEYLRLYEKDANPVTVPQRLDYYMELGGKYFDLNDRQRGLEYKNRMEKLLADTPELSDAYKARYKSYLQQLTIGELRTDPDQHKLIDYAKETLEKNKKEKFLPSAGVFFWLRNLATAYKNVKDIAGLEATFNELFYSINEYVEENVDNKISEQKYQSDYFVQQQKLKDAEELNKIKDSVFSNFNHELRTPLNIILSNCELLARDVAMPDTGSRRLVAIQNQSYNLLNIIDQFIEINKTNLQFNQVNSEVGDLVQFLQMMQSDFSTLCEQKTVTLELETGRAKQLICELDFAKLERILYNLITNAIKFTNAKGTVRVKLTTDKKSNTIVLQVSDTGIGIAKDKMATIFQQFYSAHSDNENTKSSTGFGIGLYLVEQLVKLLGGTINVESELGKGSSFKITLPLVEHTGKEEQTLISKRLNYKQVEARVVAKKPIAKKKSIADKTKPHLLIVEDNVDLLEILTASFQAGFTIKTAGNGKEAVKVLDSFLPDLVITDLMMPHMNGIELTTHIKQNAALSHLPVIMLTAKGSLPNRIKGWQAGIDVFLRKPFSITELEHCIQNIMQTRANSRKRIEAMLANTSAKSVKAETPAEKFVRDFKSYVLTNISTTSIHNASVAKYLQVDENSMYRKIKSLTGYSPVQLITRLKILRAKEFIETKQFTTLKEVAYSCGFNDPKYFSQVYKMETGSLPQLEKTQDTRQKV